jgi:hypothetical protein
MGLCVDDQDRLTFSQALQIEIADIRERERREARILFVTARVSLSMQTLELLRGLPKVFSSDMEPFDAVYADEIAQSIGSTFALRVCVCVCVCVRTTTHACSRLISHIPGFTILIACWMFVSTTLSIRYSIP